jgi:hypothetical protein
MVNSAARHPADLHLISCNCVTPTEHAHAINLRVLARREWQLTGAKYLRFADGLLVTSGS